MSNKMKNKKIIISGGGTGGHIFPALSIANALKEKDNNIEFLFIGANGKMEMKKIPEAGYKIKGLPVAGLNRSFSFSNLKLPFKVINSINIAKKIIKEFKPDVVVGVGGFASAPTLWSAQKLNIPCLIQEQNSYAGLTNKKLAKHVQKICVAYKGMSKFFPAEKIIFTGNPIRKEIRQYNQEDKKEGFNFYNLDPNKKCIFVVGGSLGCQTLNDSVRQWIIDRASSASYQIIWQSGQYYKTEIDNFLAEHKVDNVKNFAFISRMDLAYASSDIIVSRAGAGTISELCQAGKATIFVPSPNVAEDHQTHNAMALVNEKAALMVKDNECRAQLFDIVDNLLEHPEKINAMEKNILSLAKPNAANDIADEVLNLIVQK